MLRRKFGDVHPVVSTVGEVKALLLVEMASRIWCRWMSAISCERSRRGGLIGCLAPLSRLRCSFGSSGGISGVEGASVG